MAEEVIRRLVFTPAEITMVRHASSRLGCSEEEFMRTVVTAAASDVCSVDGLPDPEFGDAADATLRGSSG